MKCGNCSSIFLEGGWCLSGYFGLSGNFCSECYSLVEHNSEKEPKQPTEYLMILLKQEKDYGKEDN